MYGYGKIAVLVFIITVFISCKSAKISRTTVTETEDIETTCVEEIRSRNLFNGPISIDKISVILEEGNNTRRFRAYLRYNGTDSMLLSIRTIAGIEAARILLTDKKVEIVDRINKIYYTGKTKELGKRYGFAKFDAAIIFGDLIEIEQREKEINCVNGQAEFVDGSKNIIYGYNIDCDKKKLKEIKVYKRNDDKIISGEFKEIEEKNNLFYPGVINWDLTGQTRIELRVKRASRRNKVKINFSRQDNYTKKVIR